MKPKAGSQFASFVRECMGRAKTYQPTFAAYKLLCSYDVQHRLQLVHSKFCQNSWGRVVRVTTRGSATTRDDDPIRLSCWVISCIECKCSEACACTCTAYEDVRARDLRLLPR